MGRSIIIFVCFVFHLNSSAQSTIPVTDQSLSSKYNFIRTPFNRIANSQELDSFYEKLFRLKKTGNGVVSIVHIGDSHTQADFFPGVVRMQLQEFFGNAGRGLVFPYQLAQSNAPPDISSSSNTRWKFNRVAHPEIPISSGVSGYGIQTAIDGASFNFTLKPVESVVQRFNRLKFFLDSNKTNSWIFRAEGDTESLVVKNDVDSALYRELILEENTNGFSLSSLPSSTIREFFGVSLENSSPGILYHTIGVNGARYDQYNIAPIFWKQLAGLNADLYIVSLGTNEAQARSLNDTEFQEQVSIFIQNLRIAAPGATILITTAPDSYKQRKSNTVLRDINRSLVNYCNRSSIPVWDLYGVTNGYGSAYSWSRRGLMNRDRIHFTAEGYRIQGKLLFNALARGYNSYIDVERQ